MAPSATTFDAPSVAAAALVGAQPEWQEHQCCMAVKVPVNGETTISAKAVQRALCAAMGQPEQEEVSAVVQPTGFSIIGEHSENPTGVPIGINISGTSKTHLHVGAKGEEQAFSGLLSSRFHPSGASFAPLVGLKIGAEARADRVAIAQKWAGVRPSDLLAGVQQMTSAKTADGKSQTQFAVPIAIPDGNGGVKQQPLAWAIERNVGNPGLDFNVGALPNAEGQMVDHFMIGQEAMESIVGATTTNVFGAQALDDITISAKALGPAPAGDQVVTVGLRVNADMLNFLQMEE